MAFIPSSQFEELGPLRQGKVRDIFETEDSLLMVTTDRLSAF
ncbi:MAG: phosphoribosylaminoimidazolesuccinocarboxamide synthase, partial [Desulfobacterales bacterium]|nr:phosphoribosylaminoimidazolesuccinocarboxamide synthase [Desulfobacterales bacterium]